MNRNMKWIIVPLLVLVLAVAGVMIYNGSKQDQQTVDPVVPTVVVTEAPEVEPTAQPEAAAEVTAEPAADTTAADAAGTAAEPTADPKAVMATVNGAEVLREEIDLIYSNLVASYAQYGYDTSDVAFVAAMQRYAVEYAVQLELMEQKAAEMGFDKFTDEEKAAIEAENAANWNEIVEMYMSYSGGVTEESTEEEIAAARKSVLDMLEGMGYTEAVMLEDAMASAKLDRVEASMIEGAAVTDDEIKALFDEYVKQDEASYKEDVGAYEYMTQYYGQTSYYVPEGYRGITHILLEVDEELLNNYQTLAAELEEQEEAAEATEAPAAEATEAPAAEGETAEPTEAPAAEGETAEPTEAPKPPVTQAEVDAAYQAIIASVQPTIDEINSKLAEGVAFADLIAEYGTDPGMQQEPAKSEGYSVHMDSIAWDPAFVKAAFSVNNVGDIAEPVVGSYGVHIVQYTRDVPSGAVEYTPDIQLALHETALSQKESELFNATMETWMNEAQITYAAEAQAMINAVDAAE